MSIIQPEFEYVDRATRLFAIWNTAGRQICAAGTAMQNTNFISWWIHAVRHSLATTLASLNPVPVFDGAHLPHNWITDDNYHPARIPIRDMLVQFSQESIDQLSFAFPEFREMEPMFELAKSV